MSQPTWAPWWNLADPNKKFGDKCDNCVGHDCYVLWGKTTAPCAKCKHQQRKCTASFIIDEASDSDIEITQSSAPLSQSAAKTSATKPKTKTMPAKAAISKMASTIVDPNTYRGKS